MAALSRGHRYDHRTQPEPTEIDRSAHETRPNRLESLGDYDHGRDYDEGFLPVSEVHRRALMVMVASGQDWAVPMSRRVKIGPSVAES